MIRGRRGLRLSRRATVAGALGMAAALAVGSVAWACTVPVGFTWYSDGTTAKQGGQGTLITAYATQARANRQFNLVTGNAQGEPGHDGHACMFNVTNINPNLRTSSSSGFIPNTTGQVNSAPGVWQVCFREPSGATSTIPVSFTVT